MSDPTPTPQDFLNAESVVNHVANNLEIQFQTEGDNFDRPTMQAHVNKRAALLLTKKLLLDEGERILKGR